MKGTFDSSLDSFKYDSKLARIKSNNIKVCWTSLSSYSSLSLCLESSWTSWLQEREMPWSHGGGREETSWFREGGRKESLPH